MFDGNPNELMEENYRDELLAASNDLEDMPFVEFQERFESLCGRCDGFEPDTDILVIHAMISGDGLLDLKHQHVRLEKSGEELVSVTEWGDEWELSDTVTHALTLEYSPGSVFDGRVLMQKLYDSLVGLMTHSTPSVFFLNPTASYPMHESPDQPDITRGVGE